MVTSAMMLPVLLIALYLVQDASASWDQEKSEITNAQSQPLDGVDWWKKTNFYHIYVRSFFDSDGDGNGDLRGITANLNYLQKIGVETLLMSPFYSSPMKEGGYDIDDYLSINPMFGNMQDFEYLLGEVHSRGMRMVIDFVPNHTSNKHRWFNCSEHAFVDPVRCGQFKDYYVWVKTAGSKKPPNNWISVFGNTPQSAWKYSPIRGEWYYHQFLPEQPDLNLRNPDVRAELKQVARYWLEKGVDGLRVDALIHLYEDEQLLDEPVNKHWDPLESNADQCLIHCYTRNLRESYAACKDWRDVMNEPKFLDKATGKTTKVLITEAYNTVSELIKGYGSPEDKWADMPFNIELLNEVEELNWSPNVIKLVAYKWLQPVKELNWPKEDGAVMPWTNWVTGNHDNPRLVNRVGLYNAPVYIWLAYLLPGVPINYSGDELLIEDADFNSIPAGTIHEGEASRLMCRAPIAWDASEPSGGFSSSANIWMPLNPNYQANNVKALLASTKGNSLKSFMRINQIKKDKMPVFVFGDLVFFDTGPVNVTKVLALARTTPQYGNLLLLANTDQSQKVYTHLSAARSFYQDKVVEPPKKAKVLADSRSDSQIAAGTELDLNWLVLLPAQALVLEF